MLFPPIVKVPYRSRLAEFGKSNIPGAFFRRFCRRTLRTPVADGNRVSQTRRANTRVSRVTRLNTLHLAANIPCGAANLGCSRLLAELAARGPRQSCLKLQRAHVRQTIV